MITTLMAALSLGSVIGTWRDSIASRKLRGLIAGPPPRPALTGPGNPSKEYIYAGSKLIATEEPENGGSLAAPTSLVATAISTSSLQVSIAWTASAGADHYEIERTSNLTSAYSVLSSNVTTTSFTDSTVTSVNAYLYRVRAVDTLGKVSPYSNPDLATAITFTDSPLTANSSLIKAQHVWELRQAVNAIRSTANLAAATWTDNATTASQLLGVKVKAIHITELRTNLDAALNALSLPVSAYTDSGPAGLSGMAIKKIHIDELRQRVR